jgi:hypothetical protein
MNELIDCSDDSTQLSLEGNVVQKGECRPIGNANYMTLKKETIKQASQPTRIVQQLDKAVVNYKPIAAHKSDVKPIFNQFFRINFQLLKLISIV